MKIPSFLKVSFVALAFAYTGYFLAPQKAQAHHNVVHSTEQAATKAAVDTAAVGEKVVVTASTNTSSTLTLPLVTGGAVLLSLSGLALYTARKKQLA